MCVCVCARARARACVRACVRLMCASGSASFSVAHVTCMNPRVSQGELITMYPSDALLVWEDADHSPDGHVQVFFGQHVPVVERDASRAVFELQGYHVPITETRSIVADPSRCHDAAYLGHMANDAVACESAEFQEQYERDSTARANAEIIPLDIAEVDDRGCNLVLHFALRALKPISPGSEIFIHYGFDYWQMNA